MKKHHDGSTQNFTPNEGGRHRNHKLRLPTLHDRAIAAKDALTQMRKDRASAIGIFAAGGATLLTIAALTHDVQPYNNASAEKPDEGKRPAPLTYKNAEKPDQPPALPAAHYEWVLVHDGDDTAGYAIQKRAEGEAHMVSSNPAYRAEQRREIREQYADGMPHTDQWIGVAMPDVTTSTSADPLIITYEAPDAAQVSYDSEGHRRVMGQPDPQAR